MSSNSEFEMLNSDSDSEYSEELKLNIPCDNNKNHSGVLYCQKCEVNLCIVCCKSIHCFPATEKHKIVRLTKKPEPLVNCRLHPEKEAVLVCKEPSCDGINKPICILCQQYDTHKNHKFEILENEYNKLRSTVSNCLEKIGTKTTGCDKNLKECKRCIPTYSITDDEFMKSERDRIDKFYSYARTLALKIFDDFAETRVEKLELLQKQYEDNKTKLEDMRTLLQNFGEMGRKDLIENGGNVEEMAREAEINVNENKDILPSKSYYIKYPNLESMKVTIDNNPPTGIERLVQNFREPRNFEKTPAVYFIDSDLSAKSYCGIYTSLGTTMTYLSSGGKRKVLWEANYELVAGTQTLTLDYGRSVLNMEEEPNDKTVHSDRHTYISVIRCNVDREKRGTFYSLLDKQMKNKYYNRIVVMVDLHIWKDQKEFVDRITEIAGTDERVEVWKNDEKEIVDILFKN